ncbi:hypothetical protein [Bradyrhizobium japonicum]|uniref:hypothetical protein n=1 Tax=Bradyrhizobium japonicum TaxID=375 RepID=UPI00339127EC
MIRKRFRRRTGRCSDRPAKRKRSWTAPQKWRRPSRRKVSDTSATRGYTRKRTGTTFSYYDKEGKRITDAAVVRRIKSIGIPPAYEYVWICPSANGHIQATGLDARGRKQYRYHPKWRELRDENKYEHIVQFAAALPALRERVAADMKAGRTAPREGAGHDRQPSGKDTHPCRQRRVC